MKKLVVAAAATLALGAASLANAAGTIMFDPNGAAAGGAVAVNFFDWLPGNAIAIAALSTPPGPGGTRTFEVVSQGKLGLLVGPGGGTTLPAGQFTFQARFFEEATGLGTAASTFTLGAGGGSFTVYYNAAHTTDEIAGTGYGDGLAILSGTLTSLTGNFVNNSILFGGTCGTLGTGCGLLDQQGADNQSGVRSQSGNGSTTIEVDVTYADSDFFKSNITSLSVDLQDTTNNAAPFQQANPSDMVFGVTPVYSLNAGGTKVNGFFAAAGACAFGGKTESDAAGAAPRPRCDIHLQTDGSTSFNPVPEPGTLAVVGLGLGLLGLSRRRKAA